jgi:hypothetical protein
VAISYLVRVVIQERRDLLEENADLVKVVVKAGKEAVAADKAKHEKPAWTNLWVLTCRWGVGLLVGFGQRR